MSPELEQILNKRPEELDIAECYQLVEYASKLKCLDVVSVYWPNNVIIALCKIVIARAY